MSNKLKKILAAILLIFSSLILLSTTDDKFVKLFIITCILFSLIYMRKRNIRKVARENKIKEELDKEDTEKEDNDKNLVTW